MLNINVKTIAKVLFATTALFAASNGMAIELNAEQLTNELVNSAVAKTAVDLSQSLFLNNDVTLAFETVSLIEEDQVAELSE